MILSSILNFARTQAQTDSNGLSDTNGIVFANEALQDFHRRLIQHGVDASQIQEASITATAGTGVYPYPVNPCSIIALKTIELNYQNTTTDQYRQATQIDLSNLPGGMSMGWYRVNQSAQNPLFDDRGNQFEIFPTPIAANNLTALIRLVGFAKPSIYSTTGDTVQYPENLEEGILGYRIAANYLVSVKDYDAGNTLDAKYQQRVTEYIENLGRGSQQPLEPTPLTLTGFEF